jgi:hypothetical protein
MGFSVLFFYPMIRMQKFLSILLCTMLCGVCSLAAQRLDPLQWKFSGRHLGGDEFELVFSAKIQKGWATFSQFLSPDDGPVPTTVVFESPNATLLDEGSEEGHLVRVEKDPVFGIVLVKFQKDYIIRKRVKVDDCGPPILGRITAMCSDGEKCLPPVAYEFSIKLKKP